METIKSKIDKLPILGPDIKEMKYLISDENYDVQKLLNLIEKNSFLRTKVLRVSNNGFFAFESTIDKTSRAVHLYGMSFSLSLILFESLKNLLRPNLKAYDYTSKKFDKFVELLCFFLSSCFKQNDIELQEKLLLPVILSELGRFFISEEIIEKDLKSNFDKLFKEGILIEKVEKEFLGITCSEVSALILEKWNFDKLLVSKIKLIDNLEACKKDEEIAIINVIKTACNIHNPFSKGNISRAVEKAVDFNLDPNIFEDSIKIVLERIKEEKRR